MAYWTVKRLRQVLVVAKKMPDKERERVITAWRAWAERQTRRFQGRKGRARYVRAQRILKVLGEMPDVT